MKPTSELKWKYIPSTVPFRHILPHHSIFKHQQVTFQVNPDIKLIKEEKSTEIVSIVLTWVESWA